MKSPKLKSVVSKMPALSHWPDRSKPFAYSDSEIMRWLWSQHEVNHWLFSVLKDAGLIRFDPESKTWSGVTTTEK